MNAADRTSAERQARTPSAVWLFTPSRLALAAFFAAWCVTRLIDFSSGFVEYSAFRLVIACALPAAVLAPWGRWIRLLIRSLKVRLDVPVVSEINSTLRLLVLWTMLVLLTFAGFAIYYVRVIRGANMGDTGLFMQSIESTAHFQGILANVGENGSHFKAHNSPFLLFFVPIAWVFGDSSRLVIQFIHSLVIVTWSYIIGRLIADNLDRQVLTWPITLALFLATYGQHMTFYDTRFAALGLLVLIIGLCKKNTRQVGLGFVFALLTRETAVLSAVAMLVCTLRDEPLRKITLILVPFGLAWLAVTAMIMHALGGPVSAGRFDICLKSPQATQVYASCVISSLQNDWPLKLAYSVRLLSFGPTVALSWVGLAGIVPETALMWLSKDGVLYSLSSHYYMQIVCVVLVFGIYKLRTFRLPLCLDSMYVKWFLATALWQFATTIHPRLFT